MALEYEYRPLIGCQHASPCFHLRRKKNSHIKVSKFHEFLYVLFIVIWPNVARVVVLVIIVSPLKRHIFVCFYGKMGVFRP